MLNSRQQTGLGLLLGSEPIFVTGDAGAGKSHLIREWLRQEKRGYAITASTGVAAVNIGGCTLHSLFRLTNYTGDSDSMAAYAIDKKPRLNYDGFIVDEISMVEGRVLNACDKIARWVRKTPEKSFGGMRPVICGDFFQLPPVSEKFWAFQSKAWADANLIHFKLTEQMRCDDTHILNKVKVGLVDNEVIDWLDSRVQEPPGGTPHLFARNVDVDTYNDHHLSLIPGPERAFKGYLTGDDRYTDRFPVKATINLRVGALVMFRRNDPALGVVNGTIGTVTQLKPLVVESEGRSIHVTDVDFEIKSGAKVMATLTQVPLSLAWGVTIHKSQGATLDSVCVNLEGLWEPGQAYVALSRAKSMDRIYLQGWDKHSIKANKEVVEFYGKF